MTLVSEIYLPAQLFVSLITLVPLVSELNLYIFPHIHIQHLVIPLPYFKSLSFPLSLAMHFNKCSEATRNPNPTPDLNPNLNVSKTMQATYFLRAFTVINSASPTSSTMQRRRSIRRAAYASMARAAGNRRAWSRAVLRRLHRGLCLSSSARRFVIRRRIRVSRPREPGQADVLRSLVPGGKAMDFCNLLEETATYIQCLSAQVRLMQSLADSISEC